MRKVLLFILLLFVINSTDAQISALCDSFVSDSSSLPFFYDANNGNAALVINVFNPNTGASFHQWIEQVNFNIYQNKTGKLADSWYLITDTLGAPITNNGVPFYKTNIPFTDSVLGFISLMGMGIHGDKFALYYDCFVLGKQIAY